MFAQAIITLLLIIGISYVLWKYVGEPFVVDRYCPEDELLVDAESLREKIELLEEKRQELELLTDEVEVTAELKALIEKIQVLQTQLNKLESENESDGG
jgi:hypothetical protein